MNISGSCGITIASKFNIFWRCAIKNDKEVEVRMARCAKGKREVRKTFRLPRNVRDIWCSDAPKAVKRFAAVALENKTQRDADEINTHDADGKLTAIIDAIVNDNAVFVSTQLNSVKTEFLEGCIDNSSIGVLSTCMVVRKDIFQSLLKPSINRKIIDWSGDRMIQVNNELLFKNIVGKLSTSWVRITHVLSAINTNYYDDVINMRHLRYYCKRFKDK